MHRLTSVVLVLLLAHSVADDLGAQQARRADQYKRVHQSALRQIVSGKAASAVSVLQEFLEQHPDDAESYYMLAVAHAGLNHQQQAAESVRKALALGLPPGRFVAGTKTGLTPIQDHEVVRELQTRFSGKAIHGPMLGCVTGNGVKVWLRTATEADVQVVVSEDSSFRHSRTSASVRSRREDDYTVEVPVTNLQPSRQYRYRLRINGNEQANESWTFTTFPRMGQAVAFRLAFGGGAGYVPAHEHMWNTIAARNPDVLLLLGDNVYSDDPTSPEMQHYCYYRRQSRPEFRQLVAKTPVFSIWDDHDFGTNDCSGGPEIKVPAWKLPVYRVFRNNWVNPYYGGGDEQPGCYYDFYLGDVHFVMLDGRYYRNLKPEDRGRSTMLGPVQRKWLLDTIASSRGRFLVLCSPVPWTIQAKGNSKDTWNGFRDERTEIFNHLADLQRDGVVLISADRHRSDLWKIERPRGYPLYEFNSSRLTNQHVHNTMKEALFSYNAKQSFGLVEFDTSLSDPSVTYRVVTIDNEEVHSFTLTLSQLTDARD